MFGEMSLFISYLKNGDPQPRQAPHLLGHQHHRPRHRPCILHDHLPLYLPRMDLRHLSQKRRPHLSGLCTDALRDWRRPSSL